MRAPVRYALSGDVQVAYQITGAGPVDVVLAPAYVSHLDLEWESPTTPSYSSDWAPFQDSYRFDKRGTGLSDRPGRVATLEERVDEIRAVMDAADSERAVIIGASEGGSRTIRRTAFLIREYSGPARTPPNDRPRRPNETASRLREPSWGMLAQVSTNDHASPIGSLQLAR